jgi:hypothetical protein
MMKFAVPVSRSNDPTTNIKGVKPKKTPGHTPGRMQKSSSTATIGNWGRNSVSRWNWR